MQRSMDIGNSSAKIPVADFETLVSFFFATLLEIFVQSSVSRQSEAEKLDSKLHKTSAPFWVLPFDRISGGFLSDDGVETWFDGRPQRGDVEFWRVFEGLRIFEPCVQVWKIVEPFVQVCLEHMLDVYPFFFVARFTEGRFWWTLRLAESKMYWWLPPSFKETHIPYEVSWIASWQQIIALVVSPNHAR